MADRASTKVKYDAWLAEVQAIGTVAPIPGVIAIGARVKVAALPLLYTKVRTVAGGGTLIRSEPNGSAGTVTAGPTNVSGVNWWQVAFDSGIEGWASGAQLAAI